MLSNEILALLKQYKLIDISTELPNDWNEEDCGNDPIEIARGLFDNYLNDKSISYAGMYEEGDWDWEDLINIYKSILNNYIKSSSGAIELNNYSSKGITTDDNYSNEPMLIEFDFNDKHYSWSFSLNTSSVFYNNVTQWAIDAFDGNIIFLGGELFDAYLIPKELVNDLNTIGINSSINYFAE